MAVHLPDGTIVDRPAVGADEGDGRTWVPIDALAAVGVTVKPLGADSIGLCPDEDRCVAVPPEARSADGSAVDLPPLAGDLDLVVADDGHHVAIRQTAGGGSAARLGPGDPFDLTLIDLDGVEGKVISGDGRVAVFAWASW